MNAPSVEEPKEVEKELELPSKAKMVLLLAEEAGHSKTGISPDLLFGVLAQVVFGLTSLD